VTVALAGVLSWTNFGTFHGPNAVHRHEMFHYVVGSKYFPENRYTLLYHCTEVAEAEMGRRSFVERRMIRNLASDEMEPAVNVLENPEPCLDAFSDERWEQFKRDVEFYRSTDYPGSWAAIFRDHGYNATPLWSTIGGWITNLDSLSRRPGVLALIDALLYLGIGLLVIRAFGLQAAAVVALIWGVGFPWQYLWTGGAFGRSAWLFAAVAAVCLLKRSRFGAGGFVLACSALLRIFPVLLIVGPVLLSVRDLIRKKSSPTDRWRLAAGALLAVALLVPVSMWAGGGGAGVWSEFVENSIKHTGTPSGNDMGLPVLFEWSPGNTQAPSRMKHADDIGRWEDARRKTFDSRRPIYLTAALALLALVVLFVVRHADADWEALCASTLLIFAFSGLASYYMIYLVLLALLTMGSPRRMSAWIIAATVSQLVQFVDIAVDTRYFAESILFLVVSVGCVVDLMRERHGGPLGG
jgi:hypothetical protein